MRLAGDSFVARRLHVRSAALGLWCALAVACSPGGGVDVGARAEALRDLDDFEAQFLDLLNAHRAAHGAPDVVSLRTLNQGAYDYSIRMGTEGFFDHEAPSGPGRTFTERMCLAGYEPACTISTTLGENIAAGYTTADDVFQGWRDSPGHNANMLNADFRAVGIGRGVVTDSEYGVYWTNTFAGAVVGEIATVAQPDAGPAPEPDAGPAEPPEQDAGSPVDPIADGGAPSTRDGGGGPAIRRDGALGLTPPAGPLTGGIGCSVGPPLAVRAAATIALYSLALLVVLGRRARRR